MLKHREARYGGDAYHRWHLVEVEDRAAVGRRGAGLSPGAGHGRRASVYPTTPCGARAPTL